MARIKQVGTGRKTTGTIDGITYVTRNGVTYARTTPTMPASAYKTPAALKRQAIFKMVQMHLNHHSRTIRQTFTPSGNGTARNRYYSVNGKALTKALEGLADRYVSGEIVTINDVEAAICAYAAENPRAIVIAQKSVIVAENGVTTTINPDGSTTVVSAGGSNDHSDGSNTDPNTGRA